MKYLQGRGVYSLVDDWLDLTPVGQPPCYRHRTAANTMSKRIAPIEGAGEFLQACYQQIHSNWQAAAETGRSRSSSENWRWKRHLDLGVANISPELSLERKIVNVGGENWSNQMPVASGLTGSASNKRTAVDLVHRENESSYSFVELKVASDTPLFAAIEILLYGLMFIWSKDNSDLLGYGESLPPVLKATDVRLYVLAPEPYYDRFNPKGITLAINEGLGDINQGKDINMSFEFRTLSSFDLTKGLVL
ncbi:MAG: hypothetical protein ACI8Z1_003439 [Candidatus Azotimanducaceae bacterium]|jgi:hypothetical protein